MFCSQQGVKYMFINSYCSITVTKSCKCAQHRCQHNTIAHTLQALEQHNVSVYSAVLQQWGESPKATDTGGDVKNDHSGNAWTRTKRVFLLRIICKLRATVSNSS